MKLSQKEFEKLALEQLDSVYRLARRLVRDPNRAEDLVQETYLRALRSREHFDLQEFGMRPWLLRILYNLHLSRGERENRQPLAIDEEHLEAVEDESISPLPAELLGPEGMDQRLVRAMDALGEEYRTALMLWAVEELSYKEIAHAMDIPIGTVMSRLHRARQKLTEQLRDLAAERRLIRE
jgi:RNA polymerase sigma-70 factor (ECF subfamily)